VTGASTQIAPPQMLREVLLISAPSTAAIWVSIGRPAKVGQGIRLPPNGDPLQLLVGYYGSALHSEVTAISEGAAQQIGVLDVFG
jgi:hypothetical protein